jgi:hypothetical protein
MPRFVYLFELDGFHKIGVSHDPAGRAANPVAVENALHRRFAGQRIKRNSEREWFALTAEDIALISGVIAADSQDDLPAALQAPPTRRKGTPLHVWLPKELEAAFQGYLDSEEPAVSKTAAVEAALRGFLRGKGFWPPSPTP